jgi:hypothetical protein
MTAGEAYKARLHEAEQRPVEETAINASPHKHTFSLSGIKGLRCSLIGGSFFCAHLQPKIRGTYEDRYVSE